MKKVILFDFDGVIVDSFEAAYTVCQILELGLSRDQYRDMFMGNIFVSVDKKFSPEKREVDHQKFAATYNPLLLKLDLIDGMYEVIEKLSKKYTLVIISSSVTSPIHAYLERHEVHHFFDKVYGADVHKIKTEKIEMVFKEFKVKAKDCVFITDTVGDLLEAKEKGIESLVVLWGFHEKQRFAKHQPAAFIETPADMPKAVDQYFSIKK